MAAMAVEESCSSASMVPWVAMMAETPQTEEPTASRVVSLGAEVEAAAEPGHKGEREGELDEDQDERDAAQPGDVAEDEAGAEQDDAGLQPELVGGDAGAEDAREADGVGDEDAEEDGPEDVLDVGQGEVVSFAVAVMDCSTNLPAIADGGEEGDAGDELREGGALGEPAGGGGGENFGRGGGHGAPGRRSC